MLIDQLQSINIQVKNVNIGNNIDNIEHIELEVRPTREGKRDPEEKYWPHLNILRGEHISIFPISGHSLIRFHRTVRGNIEEVQTTLAVVKVEKGKKSLQIFHPAINISSAQGYFVRLIVPRGTNKEKNTKKVIILQNSFQSIFSSVTNI